MDNVPNIFADILILIEMYVREQPARAIASTFRWFGLRQLSAHSITVAALFLITTICKQILYF